MKTIMRNCTLLCMLLLMPLMVMAGGSKGKYTKVKKINKSFNVTATAGLNIANKYGNVYVTTWDEDKTVIDVTITVSGNDEDNVIRRLNGITVDFNANPTLVAGKTVIESFRGKISLEINYTIKIPKRGTVGISNQYGGIKLGKIYGATNISCEYGDVTAEELNSESNNINIQYCSDSGAGYIKAAVLSAQYSSFKLTNGGSLQAKCDYTDLKIGDINDVDYKANYGDVIINNAANITGKGDYLTLKFYMVKNIINLTTDYSNIAITLGPIAKNLAIHGDYTNTDINHGNSYPFDFEFNLDYGNVRGTSGFQFSEKIEKNSRLYYKGYYRGSGTNKIYVSSNYGNVNLIKT